MKDRIDSLIKERAPWLFAETPAADATRRVLDELLGYKHTLALGTQMRDLPAQTIMDSMADRLAQNVSVEGLENLPTTGPALIVCNHPTGIADGIMIWHAVARKRPDLFYFANHDILRVFPQMNSIIAPVEWQAHKRTHAKTRDTLNYMREAVAAERIGVIFPSGRLAKRRGLSLHERPWMASAAMLARKFDLPVIPINIAARNSALFYLFDLLHPSLRDITLFHETLNKARQPFRITIGTAIAASALPKQAGDGILMLKRKTLALGGHLAPTVSLVESTRIPRGIKPAPLSPNS